MEFGLKGKVAIVTGAGSRAGFGRTIALILASEGCHVAVIDINLEGAEETAENVRKLGRESMALKVDVTNLVEVKAMVDGVLRHFGRIDILVNNAGAISGVKPFSETEESDWNSEIAINLRGVFHCTKAVLPHMVSRRSGKIINISAIASLLGAANMSTYSASKGGVVSFTKALGVELGPNGIQVNSIAPGLGLTGFGGGLPPDLLEEIKGKIPTRKTTTPEDIANAVAFLASERANNIVGQILCVDGGSTLV
jgi:NAD(P)-dependent dehydrogenase (short-subunit alcohol dehydrogenase family)